MATLPNVLVQLALLPKPQNDAHAASAVGAVNAAKAVATAAASVTVLPTLRTDIGSSFTVEADDDPFPVRFPPWGR
jgi:hypothetical protein